MGRENGRAGNDFCSPAARKHADALRLVQNRVLELAIRDTSLGETLEALIAAVEAQSADGVLGSILLLDEGGKHLRHGAAPSLPDAYNEAIDGVAIGPGVGSCGTAAYSINPVYVSDIAEDPLWADFRELALVHGLRACWSTPIVNGADEVLGTFAMYYREPRAPAEDDLELVDFVTRSAALIIENKQGQEALHEESRRLETLNRTAADIATELDLERLVQRATDAGVELTGADFGAFFYNVLDPEGESYMLYTLSGAERSDFEGFPMPRNTAVFGPTFAGEGVVRSGDITQDPRYGNNKPRKGMPEGHLPVRSYLAVPVIGRSGEVIGGLFFGHKESARFTEAHERLITGIAAQSAIGIDNARLYQAAQNEIAERTRAENALRESEARFRGLVSSTNQVLYRHNPDWSEMRQLVGGGFLADTEEPDPDWFDKYIHPDDQPHVREAIDKAIRDKGVFELEHRVIREDGMIGWTFSRSIPIFGEDGEIAEWFGAAADVSARHEAEEALRESEARFRRIADSTPAPMWVTRLDRKREFVNRAYVDFLGISYEEAVDFDWREILHPEDHDGIVAESIAGEASLKRFALEGRYQRKDGEWHWMRSISQPKFDVEGELTGFIGVAHDVTEMKQAEEALRNLNDTLESRVEERTAELMQAQEALRQSQKLEAMGQLTGGVAHDFNNLLSPIIGGLDMVQRRGVGDERTRRQIDGALQSAERAKTLVQRLLAFARRQPLQAKAVDMGELVNGMVDLIDSTLGPSIEVRVDLAEGCPPAKADANQVEMALLNIAVNARDAMPDGGTLTLHVSRDKFGAEDKPDLAPGEYVRLCVADTGIGMDQETRQRAVEPFFSTKGVGRGTGLGLSMVHGLAAQLGGRIEIESAPGEGTAVKLWLPASSDTVDRQEQTGEIPASAGTRGKVLLVDDEMLVRLGTADMLDDLGYEVAEASSAEEALRLLEEGLEPDLLVTDHLMPGMNGADLAREVRRQRPTLPVLLISGYAEVEGIEPDIVRLTKPFRESELAKSLSTLMPA